MELIILLLFAASILIFSLLGQSIIYALLTGYILFAAYALYKKNSPKEILHSSLLGVYKVRNIIILFLLIGTLTAVWRASATIPTIIYYTAGFLHPKFILLMCFLLNCVMSFLTGTSFGTAATLGTITMGIANTMGINPLFSGGAIMSGIFFGDRCSAVSTSALLVAESTGTELYTNIKNMMRSSIVPFMITCVLYLLLGLLGSQSNASAGEMTGVFATWYQIHWINLLPAAMILVFSCFKINVKITLICSILCGCIISVVMQGTSVYELGRYILAGYKASDSQAAVLFNGGGISSMLRVTMIIIISSTYSGLFEMTHLLDRLSGFMEQIARKGSIFTATLTASILSALIACNQTLATLLVDQLCSSFQEDKYAFACDMEDSVILISPLVPWSIAGAVPIATIGAPFTCLMFAFYLYLVPVYRLLGSYRGRKKLVSEKSSYDA